MAKYSTNPMTAQDLVEYLTSQDDFGLELFTYSKARSLGLTASHGGTYEDPVTNKPRQYDVRAFAVRDDRRIDLAIECKSLRESFPLIVSRIPRIRGESFHHLVWSCKHSPSTFSIASAAFPPAKTLTIGHPASIYPEGALVGKSTVQVGRNDRSEFVAGDADVYDKWAQALGSAAELIKDAAYHHEGSVNGVMSSAILPVLVVADETLWVADYTEEGALQGEPHKVEEAFLFVSREYWWPIGISFTMSHLHICTKTGVERLLERVAGDDSFWEALLPPEEILKAAVGG